jgi:hypothetical protein
VTDLAVGTRLRSCVSDTEVIVIQAPSEPAELSCGTTPMSPDGQPAGARLGDDEPGALLGKRYVDERSGVEVLCTKAGAGDLAVNGRTLTLKAAKALPASD